MKKLHIFLLFVTGCFYINGMKAQDGESLKDINDMVLRFTSQLESGKSFEVINSIIDSISGDESKSFAQTLDLDIEYYITAFGNNRIFTLTLKVSGSNNEEIENSSAFTKPSYPFITLKPSVATSFGFIVHVKKYSGEFSSGHYAVIIYRKVK